MKVAFSVIQARRQALAGLLENHRYLPLGEVCSRLGISTATARRDLSALVDSRQVTRTYGGALSAYDATFASFADRRALAREAKAEIARRALAFIAPGMTCFFDSGTTVFALAEELYRKPAPGLCAVTNSLPVAEMLGRSAKMEVHLLGGRFLQRQSILLGKAAQASARQWRFDLVFLGMEGFDRVGIWNSDPEVAAFQRTLMNRARRVMVCAHAKKLGQKTDSLVARWNSKIRIITDAAPALCARHGLKNRTAIPARTTPTRKQL